jgi:hypothetical protein
VLTDAFVDDGFGPSRVHDRRVHDGRVQLLGPVVNHVTSSTGASLTPVQNGRPDPLVLHVGQRADLRAQRTGAERAGTGKARQAVHGRGDLPSTSAGKSSPPAA